MRPQALVSFQEHTAAQSPVLASASPAPHVFSNEFLLHPPPVFNVIVMVDLWLPGQIMLDFLEFDQRRKTENIVFTVAGSWLIWLSYG
jgi:hypothetical protein